MASLVGDRNSVLQGTWALGAIAVIVVVLRIFAKARIRHMGLDDVAMISFALSASIFFTIALDYGFASGRPGADEVLALEYYVLMEVCSVISTCLGRVAFILYLLPVLATRKSFKISLWILFAMQIAANLVIVVLILSQCHDIRGVWDPKYATDCMEDYIQVYFGYFLCFCNSTTDLLLAVFPSYIFWDLKLKPMIKFSLMILTSLGIVATVGAIMKAVYLRQILTWDSTANAIELTCWAMIECYLVIISASVPCLRSLVISSVRQLFASDKSSNFPITSLYRNGTASHQRATNRVQTNPEASGSRQNFFSGARGEDIEMGATRTSVNANDSDDGGGLTGDGIAKTVDISVTWEEGHRRDRVP
ncbi:hypothetical protein N7537_004864 [Penicillium hordei]|uniref:Rhodopsin domain-containing protein n=1 Tax=Penicillium hordei TaxID=40994 RepID=A0AAD6ED75_9EURO|nr:uncharacterized protein N7537_004864 [Penicillium hordei]KAJ5608245.1 hypothetical protein N7537_004864 [Penicillium hordei]